MDDKEGEELLPAKKYDGGGSSGSGDFPYPLKYDETGTGKWRRESRLPSDTVMPKIRTGSRNYHDFDDKCLYSFYNIFRNSTSSIC